MSKQSIFNFADFAIIRAAKNCDVKLKDVPIENVVHLIIDNEDVTIKKTEKGHMNLTCSCLFCGGKGVAKKLVCRRILAAHWWLIRRNGRVSQIQVKP